jgi:hypothetical protein
MPKTSRAHRRKRATNIVVKKPQMASVAGTQEAQPVVAAPRPRSGGMMQGTQGLMMSAMVALGCWGLAAYYTFVMNDSNHFLFGGFAAVLALLWSFSFGLRVRRWQQKR